MFNLRICRLTRVADDKPTTYVVFRQIEISLLAGDSFYFASDFRIQRSIFHTLWKNFPAASLGEKFFSFSFFFFFVRF